MVGGRITAEVATVSKDVIAISIFHAQTLVNEVPDKASLVIRIVTDEFPIVGETTHRVTHSMSILTLNQGAVVVAFTITMHPTEMGIHGTVNICGALGSRTFVLHGALRVIGFNPVVNLIEIHTMTCLITHTPRND